MSANEFFEYLSRHAATRRLAGELGQAHQRRLAEEAEEAVHALV